VTLGAKSHRRCIETHAKIGGIGFHDLSIGKSHRTEI
jgi:hypothetical protein